MGVPTQFFDTSIPMQGGNIVGWNWNFGDPGSGVGNTSSMQNPTHIFSTTGFFDVTLIIENESGCFDTIIQTLEIYIGPPVDFFYEEACLGDPTYFYTDTSVTNIGSIVLFACGLAQLGLFLPRDMLLRAGLTPFLFGDVLKMLAAAGLLPLLWKLLGRSSTRFS